MYKDVKKKILAVVLCVCMIVGAVEIVPRVKAAVGTSITFSATYGSATGKKLLFTVKIDQTSFTYTGEKLAPKIDSITDNEGGTYNNSYFSLSGPESVNVNTSSNPYYTCEVKSNGTGWIFDQNEDLSFQYEITPINITEIYVQRVGTKIPVADYTGSTVVPDKKNVSVTVNGGKKLTEGQFEFTGGQSNVGVASAKVNITDSNYSQGSYESDDFKYVIAYNLGNKNPNTGCTATLNNVPIDYDGSSEIADPTVDISIGGQSTITVSRTDNKGFQIKYIKLKKNASGEITGREEVTGGLTQAGEYEIEVSAMSDDPYVKIDDNYFTGTFTKEFSVTRLQASSLIVSAKDQYGASHDLNGPNANGYILKLPFNGEGKVTVPSGVVVKDSKGGVIPESNYTITYENETEPGVATMYITPTGDTNYQGRVAITYHITSSLYMEKTVIIGVGGNGGTIIEEDKKEPHIVYDGQKHTFDLKNCVVKAEGRERELIPNLDYTLTVQYWDGNQFVDVKNDTEDKLKEVGPKRIVITGQSESVYDGQVGYQKFYIEPVDVDNPNYRQNCSIVFDPSEYYYTGSAIIPNFKFYYETSNDKILVGTKDDPQGNFDYVATNNINAGNNAKLTLTMSGTNFKGTYEVTFEIKKLPYQYLKIDGEYIYNGKEQTPVYKIKEGAAVDFTLRPGTDYELVGYKENGTSADWTKTAPKNAGAYDVQIRIINENISCGKDYIGYHIFNIKKCNIANLEINILRDDLDPSDGTVKWNGGETRPGLELPDYMTSDDYVLEYENNDHVSTKENEASVTITAANDSKNFEGSLTRYFTISSRNLSDDGISFDITKTSSGDKPPYTLRLDVTDKNRGSNDRTLNHGTHYEINEILRYNYETDKWVPINSSDYNIQGNTITGLEGAGRYRVTIKGKGDYKGISTSAETTCGIDISDIYVVRINSRMSDSNRYSTPYNGTDQFPTNFSLYKEDTNQTVADIKYADGDFTVAYERTDTYNDLNMDVGKIYVVAIGVPEKGYFGKTKVSDTEGCFYNITPSKWDSTNFEIEIENVTYLPGGMTQVPEIVLKFAVPTTTGGIVWEILEKDRDYTATYNGIDDDSSLTNDLQNQGTKQISITGIKNHAGNIRTKTYKVLRRDINDKEIEVENDAVDFSSLQSVKFIIDHLGYKLVEGKDYTKQQKMDPTYKYDPIPNDPDDNKSGFHVFYTLTGKGNYTGEREVRVDLNIVNFTPEDIFAPSKEEAKVGQFYVEWVQDELLITSDEAKKEETQRKQITPEQFKIIYKSSETSEVTLKLNKDYQIDPDGYGTNYTAGESSGNYVTIRGVDGGGYSGWHQLKFKLYTDISGAQIADVSLIKDGGVITKPDWMNAYEKGEKTLLTLNQISNDEQGTIDPNEYNLKWDTNFDPSNPAVGSWTVRVIGSQEGKHCYYKDFSIKFRIVNSIRDAQISVGLSNSLQYQGADNPVVVTASGVNFTVTVDGKPLILGKDYEITGYSGNNRIGKATVTLKGIGDYSETVDHEFYVTYPADDLDVFVWDQSKREWVNSKKDRASYSYTGTGITPDIRLYCPLDVPEGADGEKDYTNAQTLNANLYRENLGYENNVNVGTGYIVIEGCPYFTGGKLSVPFSIAASNIGNISIRSDKYDVNHIVVEYGGKYFTAEDFGIKLYNGQTELKEGIDYIIQDSGDTMNVSHDPGNLPKLIFVGVGNYDGSRREVAFTIEERSIADASVVPNDIFMTYTDNASEQAIFSQMNITFTTLEDKIKKLVYGTDYEILGYYTDPTCKTPVSAATGVLVQNGDSSYYIPTAQGTYYINVGGIGNFKSRCVVKLEIAKKDLTNAIKVNFVSSADCIVDNSGEPDCTYNGSKHEPDVVVTYGNNNALLSEERDYTVRYENTTNAGKEATVIVTMTPGGNYDGEVTRTFTIKPKNIQQIEGGSILYSEIPEHYDYDGSSHQPEITIRNTEMPTQNEEKLEQNIHYTVDYNPESWKEEQEDSKDPCTYGGKVVVVVTGIGNYTGTQEFVYYIGEDIGSAYVRVDGSNSRTTTYNGLNQPIADSSIAVLTDDSNVDLVIDGVKRYDYAYYKNDLNNRITPNEVVDAGTYYIAVTGNPRLGTYAKSSVENSCTYTINPRSISPEYIKVSGYEGSYYFTGQAIEPKAIKVEDTDLPVTVDMNDPQRRTLTLTNGLDYDVAYRNNVSAGKAVIVVTGKGNYTGVREAYFNIISTNATGNNTWDNTSEGTGSLTNGSSTILASDIILGFDNSTYNCMMYTGYPRTPDVNINGISKNEFIITAENNVNPGMATLTITGAGNNYTGSITKYYAIKADLGTYGKVLDIADQVYTGSQITPNVTVTCGGNLLNQGTDYTVTYANNVSVGTANVTAYAANDSYYIGSVTGRFNISNTAGGMQVTGYASSYTYTGNAITPDVVVTMNGRVLNRGTDYTVSYSNNINVGTATMTVRGIGSYSGTQTINFTIEAKNIENCTTTEVTNYQYTGSTFTPNVTVTDSSTGKTLVAGTDYTITYSNNTNPGTASVTVTALSKNYTGTKVISFKITSAAVSGLRTSTIKNNSIKLAWSAQDYADGYQICNSKNRVVATTTKNSYTVKGLTSCTTYKFKVRSYVENEDGSISYGGFSTAVSAKTLLNTPTLKVKSTSKGKVTLTWTKVAKATGYEIYYSTKKNGVYTRLKTISKSSKRRYVDSGLASGEKYYYTIRAYRTANGVKTYSSYNTIKSVKVK